MEGLGSVLVVPIDFAPACVEAHFVEYGLQAEMLGLPMTVEV